MISEVRSYIFVEMQLVSIPFSFDSFHTGSGGDVVDNTLDYQSRDREIDPLLLRSFG